MRHTPCRSGLVGLPASQPGVWCPSIDAYRVQVKVPEDHNLVNSVVVLDEAKLPDLHVRCMFLADRQGWKKLPRVLEAARPITLDAQLAASGTRSQMEHRKPLVAGPGQEYYMTTQHGHEDAPCKSPLPNSKRNA